MPSQKTPVIEYIFNRLYDTTSGTLTRDVVTFDDITDAIRDLPSDLSRANPANFWKDLTRSADDTNWPASVLARGFTGDDAIGSGARASFRFIGLPPGQMTAFPAAPQPPAALRANPLQVQSVSLQAAARLLGRRDETWLAQVAQRLNVIETHFALASARSVIEVDFLQTGIKLGSGEIDVAYRLTERYGERWLVAVEAKGLRERIWVPQVSRAAEALWATVSAGAAALGVVGVIPFAIKIIGDSLVHTVEFDTLGGAQLSVISEAVIQLRPRVEGIS